MSTAAPHVSESVDAEALVREGFDRLKSAFKAQTHAPTLGEREADLEKVAQWSLQHQDAICDALNQDFGGRSTHETLVAEVWFCINGIRHTQKHLKQWMRPQRKPMLWVLRPATAQVHRQPVGVVGIIAPWNYPWQLAVAPMIAALAAGNRVFLKPSELTPHTSAILRRMVGELFEPDQVAIVEGDASVGAAFSALPFDHLLFTGSTRVGRYVLQAAAPNLTPVTLELGGKSPVVVHPSFDLDTAATRIAFGKCFSAGQTCIAPDYVLMEKSRIPAFVEAMKGAVTTLFPSMADNGDYTAIANEHHENRLRNLIADAEAKGATVEWLHPEGGLEGSGKLGPVCIVDPTEEMHLLQEEIFGPVLPIVGLDHIDQAVDYINDRPHPLALYVFDDDRSRADAVLARTTSGGATVNDTLLHISVDDLPFGGVGPSGMGAYHGEAGFKTFSHEKSVFYQPSLNGSFIVRPPYGKAMDLLLKVLLR